MLSMTDKPAPTPLLAPLVLPPNFRDVTAERIGTVFAIIGATAAQGTAAVSFADAGADPATLGLRRAFHSALAMRLRMLKAKLRMAVIQHDLLGLGGTNIAARVQRDADRLAAFDRWLGITTSQVMSGIWLEAAVTRAWIAGRENATSAVGAAVYAPTPASATASARTELASLTGAMAYVVLWIAESAVVAHLTPSQAWKKLSAAFDSATKDKAVAFANRTITVTYLRAKAETYRQGGAKIPDR
jgi:hypothetical protein